jgi:Ca2+/Na+ antiporter
MKIKYETGTATLVQFIALSLLGILNALNSIISTCHSAADECVTNAMLSTMFFMITVFFFAVIWVLGYTVQDRRSKRLAQLLIMVELLIMIVALFNARHHTDILSLFTSVLDFGLAVWVIVSAAVLIKYGGKRVVTHRQRPRKRRK